MRLRKIIIELSNHHYIAFLPILFATLLFTFYLIQIIRGKISGKWFGLAAVIFIFFTHSYDFFQETTLNPDEEQWLVCANSIIDSPSNWMNSFALYDYSRIFTIAPLLFLSIFHNFLTYDDARLVNLLLFLLFIFIQFKIVKLAFNRETAFFTISLLLVFFGISFSWDFVSYNSEMPAIVLISLAIYLLTKENTKLTAKHTAFTMGLVTSFIVFTKEQALLIAAMLVIIASFHYLRQKKYSRLILYYSGGIAGVLIVYIPLIGNYGAEEVLWTSINSIEYSQQGLSAKPAISEKSYFTDMIKLVWINKEYFIISSLAIISLIIQLVLAVRNNENDKLRFGQMIFILLTFVTLYTIYLPQNFFFHYTLFLLVPVSGLTGWLYFKYSGQSKKIIIITCIFGALIISKIYDNQLRLFYPLSEFITPVEFPRKDEISALLEENTRPGDKMIIWGWANTYYLSYELQRSSGFLYPYFAMGQYSGKQHTIDLYLKDVNKYKPKVIVELAGKNRFMFTDKEQNSIQKNAPRLMEMINSRYNRIAEDSNFVFYLRK